MTAQLRYTSHRNPLFNVAVTFMEVFPVGLVVTLVSAGFLRRRDDPGDASAARVTSMTPFRP